MIKLTAAETRAARKYLKRRGLDSIPARTFAKASKELDSSFKKTLEQLKVECCSQKEERENELPIVSETEGTPDRETG